MHEAAPVVRKWRLGGDDLVAASQRPFALTSRACLVQTKGQKWAANKWIHVHNFVDNWKLGLTG